MTDLRPMLQEEQFSGWQKASYSNPSQSCVEIGWRKTSYSGPDAACVEVHHSGAAVGVRDTKNQGHVLEFPPSTWARFLSDVTRS
ncbi:DUF397 domain-containing protein [Umezawaea sp. Da 62-37]|uniref:DUF397 domain-containing protein n=1 Tax=Umezawaea sp. Da 62-37 TaxID=3075927 RepID=UPI0028F6DB73|nr:DUF397 domain-containing protein [Umezawaea sp. Da 62-37]WNV88529.1 DUF397 domain-containing protein [Umezawaea sp. Da 62-37]